jgi:hypothetical protein
LIRRVSILASMRNCKTSELRFSAVLREGSAERLEVTKA